MYDPSRPLISVHIPKCAGTSLADLLGRWFGDGFFHPRRRDLDAGGQPAWDDVWDRASAIGHACVHGHFHGSHLALDDHLPQADQLITFVRDPLEVAVSFYHFARRAHGEGRWAAKREVVERLLRISLDEHVATASGLLPSILPREGYREDWDERYLFVGVVERMGASIGLLAGLLGKPDQPMGRLKAAPHKEAPGADAVAAFRERNAVAYAMYERATERLSSDLARAQRAVA